MDEFPQNSESPPPSPRQSRALPIIGGVLLLVCAVLAAFWYFSPTEAIVEFHLSDPKAAVRWQIDGKDFMPPVDFIAKLPEGNHVLVITGEDYEDEKITFHAKNGAREIVKVLLRQKPIDPAVLAQRERDRLEKAARLRNEGQALLDAGKPEQALVKMDEALAVDAISGEGWYRRALIGHALKKHAQALQDAEEALKKSGPAAKIHTLRTLVFLDQKDYGAIIQAAEEALKADPKAWAVFAPRGDARLHQGEYAKAIADYSMAIQGKPGDTLALANRGLAYGYLGQWEKSANDLQAALKNMKNPAAAYLLSEVQALRGNLEAAQKTRADAVAAQPNLRNRLLPIFPLPPPKVAKEVSAANQAKSADLLKKALAAFANGYKDNAMEVVEEAIALDEFNAAAVALRGAIHWLYEDKVKAQLDSDKAIKLDTASWRAYLTRANMWGEAEPDKTIADATVAVALADKDPGGWTRRAIGYKNKHEYQQAVADCQAALKLDANDRTALKQLGYLHAILGDYDKALVHYDKYLTLVPKNDPRAYWYREAVHLKKEDRPKADLDRKKIVELDDDLAGENPLVWPEPKKFPGAVLTKDQLANLDQLVQQAQAAVKKQDWTAALGAADSILKIEPTDLKGFEIKAKAALMTNNNEACLDACKRGREIDPTNAAFYALAGAAHTNKPANLEAAIADFSVALRLRPDALTYRGRAQAFFNRGDYAPARADFDAAVNLDKNLPGLLKARTAALIRLGDYEKALIDLDAVLKNEPKDSGLRWQQADLLEKIGNQVDAADSRALAQKLDPEGKTRVALPALPAGRRPATVIPPFTLENN